jgi:hypothetical protein
MAKQEITAVQIQMAAAAGVKLLQVDDLAVPLAVAKSGALGILEGMLQALANGEVVLSQPKEVPALPAGLGTGAPADPPPEGDPPPKKGGNGSKDATT